MRRELVKIPKLERNIKRGFNQQADINVTVKCPNKVTWVKGKIFFCKATSSSGTRYRVQVKLGSESSTNLNWKVVT